MADVRNVLLKRVEEVGANYQTYRNNPFKPKNAHQLRVSIRELRGLLNFIKEVIGSEIYTNLNDPLRECAHVFEDVRELDVLSEICDEIALDYPDASNHYYALFHELDINRRKEMRRTFNKTNTRLLENTIKNVNKDIEKLDLQIDVSWDKFIADQLQERYKELVKAYDEVDLEDYEEAHQIRINAKKVRYAAKYFKQLTTLKTKKIRKKAEEIQDKLGVIVDAHVNQDLLQHFEETTDKKELKKLLRQVMQMEAETINEGV